MSKQDPHSLQWVTDPSTTTLDELRQEIYAENSTLDDGLLPITVDVDSDSVNHIEIDDEFRMYIRGKADEGVQDIFLRLEGLRRPMSKITAADANRIYRSNSSQVLEAVQSAKSGYAQAAENLFVSLKYAVKAASPRDESTYSLYQNLFHMHAVSLFPELRLSFNKPVSGRQVYDF
ncbi:hypothetical protein BG004_002798 [Podila humilis]|nr:hypothetical protein BG004_002798 [Podila humilis]